MKKFLILSFLLAALFTVQHTDAQPPSYKTTARSIDTASNADTLYVLIKDMPSKLKSITATLKKLSGTISTSAYVMVQASNDGLTYFDITTDTLHCADQLYNSKTWTYTSTFYNSYRIVAYIPTGTETSTLFMTYVRRPDE